MKSTLLRQRKAAGTTPFLRWPGGKRWATPVIGEIVGQWLNGTYLEPFLGGGAVFFSVVPERAILSDLNPHLIDTYSAIRDRPREVVRLLKSWEVSADMFYWLRDWYPDTEAEKAARFLFLNRTAFSGMYRENRGGQYNVPFGGGERTTRILIETDMLLRTSEALQCSTLTCGDFSIAFSCAAAGDVIYCDPPYPIMQDGGFERYNGQVFSWADQVRLAACAQDAQSRGVTVVISNAFDQSIEQLYPTAAVQVLERYSRLSRTVEGRRVVREGLFVLEGK